MYFAASAIMTTVTTINAVTCTQKLLANPALLLICVFICGHLPLVLRLLEPCEARASSTVSERFAADELERCIGSSAEAIALSARRWVASRSKAVLLSGSIDIVALTCARSLLPTCN